MVRQARKLAKERGILELPGPKQGKVIFEETKGHVVDFCCDDEYSRLIFEEKDCVTISRNVRKRCLQNYQNPKVGALFLCAQFIKT